MKPGVGIATLAAVLFAAAGCTSTSVTATSATSAAKAPTTYTSHGFTAALTIVVDPSMHQPPIEDSAGLLTWSQSGGVVNRIRLLIPAKYYTAGARETDPVVENPPPADYYAYLQSLPSKGAVLSEESTITVSGQKVPILDIDYPLAPDASIGCSTAGALVSDGDHCFGFGPDYDFRVAVITHDGVDIVAWARTSPTQRDAKFNAIFERMLRSIRFSS